MNPFIAAPTIAAEEEPNPLVPHTAEIILSVVVFVILVWAIKKFVMPKFEQAFAQRTEAIEGGLKQAEEAQAEAARLLEEYKQQLAEARSEAAQIREGARAEGQQIVEEMRAQAQTEADRITQRGEDQLAAQRERIVGELRGELGRLSVTLASRVVGESLDDDARRHGTVDRFLDELDGMSERA